jgi:hypothetical protein
MLTGTAVVEDGDVPTDTGVEPIGNTLRIFFTGEAEPGVGAVAERLDLRFAAPA